ncbi:hypothetical protein F0562_003931 [Nyssa sinensis]|uniref:BHLH domain-containing protein n=1 Tax=Nyssa sinensis TaxID=561372 RepID=A0A5J5C0R6_9ASTE|nr:hypothetical protein F0562_003931 [Nyssa sinensis]
MDQRKTDDFSQPVNSNSVPSSSTHFALNGLANSHPEPRQRPEGEAKDSIAARKVQKADREKLRRDKQNEQFLELGNAVDPDRPKNDKATILTDTIQLLKDLTAEVNRLKADCAAFSEESRELTHEKNELREEKASLKSDIDNLNAQYQQRLGVMFPWGAVNSSVVVAPPYSFPVPLPVRPGPIPMHPSLQPFAFFGNQNIGTIPNPCSTPANPLINQPSAQYVSTSYVSNKQDSRSKSSDCHKGNKDEESDDSNNVVTDLELKTPGSTTLQESSTGKRKGKQPEKNEKSVTDRSSLSMKSSSQGFQDSSSNSVNDVMNPNN